MQSCQVSLRVWFSLDPILVMKAGVSGKGNKWDTRDYDADFYLMINDGLRLKLWVQWTQWVHVRLNLNLRPSLLLRAVSLGVMFHCNPNSTTCSCMATFLRSQPFSRVWLVRSTRWCRAGSNAQWRTPNSTQKYTVWTNKRYWFQKIHLISPE